MSPQPWYYCCRPKILARGQFCLLTHKQLTQALKGNWPSSLGHMPLLYMCGFELYKETIWHENEQQKYPAKVMMLCLDKRLCVSHGGTKEHRENMWISNGSKWQWNEDSQVRAQLFHNGGNIIPLLSCVNATSWWIIYVNLVWLYVKWSLWEC